MSVIVIDPGHGGKDSGAVSSQAREKDLNLELANLVSKELKDVYGAKVIMTRDKDVSVELKDRARIANENNANVFISIHFNSGSPVATGFEVLFHPNSVKGKTLASKIIQELDRLKILKNRGIVPRSDLYVLNATKMPAVIVEVAFVSNSADVEIYRKHKALIAKSIARGIANYLGLKEMPKKYYRITLRTGVYFKREDAEKAFRVIREAVKKVASIYDLKIVEEKK